MALTPAGYRLIQSWEGCRLQAYPDPASGGAPWTIGYGHTGPEVKAGLVISQQQADAWFRSDVARFESAVDCCLLPNCALSPQQRDALVSFCMRALASESCLARSTAEAFFRNTGGLAHLGVGRYNAKIA